MTFFNSVLFVLLFLFLMKILNSIRYFSLLFDPLFKVTFSLHGPFASSSSVQLLNLQILHDPVSDFMIAQTTPASKNSCSGSLEQEQLSQLSESIAGFLFSRGVCVFGPELSRIRVRLAAGLEEEDASKVFDMVGEAFEQKIQTLGIGQDYMKDGES